MGYYRTAVNSYARGRPYPQMGYKPRRPNRGGYKKPRYGAPVRQGQRVRRGNAGRTVTKRKQRRTNKIVRHGDNSSASFTSMGSRWSAGLKTLYRKVLGRQNVSDQGWGSKLSAYGTQETAEYRYFEKSSLDAMTTAANGGVSTNNAVRLFIGNISVKTYFKNQSNAVGKLMIYDIVFKKSTPTTSLDDGRELWAKGYTDFGAGAVSRIGATPAQSSEFRNYCMIKRVTTVDLEPGQQHTHVLSRSINKVYDSTLWANNVGQSIGWLTGSVMYVWHGSLAHESAATGTVTFTEMRLDFAISQEYNYGYVEKNVPSYTILNTYPSTLVDPDLMGESGDVDANLINA